MKTLTSFCRYKTDNSQHRMAANRVLNTDGSSSSVSRSFCHHGDNALYLCSALSRSKSQIVCTICVKLIKWRIISLLR